MEDNRGNARWRKTIASNRTINIKWDSFIAIEGGRGRQRTNMNCTDGVEEKENKKTRMNEYQARIMNFKEKSLIVFESK